MAPRNSPSISPSRAGQHDRPYARDGQEEVPIFSPRNTMDIVIMSAVDNNTIGWATDYRAICDYIDAKDRTSSMMKHNCSAEEVPTLESQYFDNILGRTPATDAMGVSASHSCNIRNSTNRRFSGNYFASNIAMDLQIKPRAGQPASIRAMPSCPEFSIRLWPSCGFQFGMDFIKSNTGEPVNLSHRFHLCRLCDLLDSGPELPSTMHIGTYKSGLPLEQGEEIYYLHAGQEYVVQDTLQTPLADAHISAAPHEEMDTMQQQVIDEPIVRLLKFSVPKHPYDIVKPLPPSVVFDELQFSLDS
ncbi:hypothetical protein D9619_011669 [Psilocybe cf. subviscida]|uniref:Uncharacterized protein n=1 Tax=Psilocybe cf. subviscida TaxID=2480587 RepID=A0A8H5F9I7_9AGAR|nr:hypothetical protein D9619_011669 [Psilocybe cf. subviscida]